MADNTREKGRRAIAGQGELDDEMLPNRGKPEPQPSEADGDEGSGGEDVPDEGVRTAAALGRRADEDR